MNRRQFIQAASASLLTAGLSARAARADVGLGFSLYGMKTLPLADALKTCSNIGYRHVELALNPGYPTEPKLLSASDRRSLRDTLARLRLNVSGLMDNLGLVVDDKAHAANLERIKAAAQLAHDLAPDRPPILESVLGGKPDEWETLKDRMAERVRSWAETAAANKLVVCLKPHVSSAVNSPERLLWLHRQAASPWIKLCYDYSHFQLAGLGLEESLKPLIAETRFIHLKDVAGDAKKFQFLLPGDGTTDYARLAALLDQFQWTGPVVVEVSAQVFNLPGYDPVTAAKKCHAALAALR